MRFSRANDRSIPVLFGGLHATPGVLAAALMLLSTCARAPKGPRAQTLLGRGQGIDHVTVMTHNLAAASATYADRLGFTFTPFAKYPDGYENAVAYFADDTIRRAIWRPRSGQGRRLRTGVRAS